VRKNAYRKLMFKILCLAKAYQVQFVFLVALVLRLGYVLLFVGDGDLLKEDQLIYLSMAENISNIGFEGLSSERVPGYPVFLNFVFSVASNILWVPVIQAIVDSVTCVLIGMLTYRIFGAGFLLAGLLSAFNLNMIIVSAMILTDTVFLFLFVAALLSGVSFLARPRFLHYLGCIVLLSAATMVRSASYYLIPLFLFGIALWSGYMRVKMGHVIAYFVTGLLVAAIIISPQHFKNWMDHGSFAYASQGGSHMLGWVVPAVFQYSGEGSYQQGQELGSRYLNQVLLSHQLAELPSDPFESSELTKEAATLALKELGITAVAKAWVIGSAVNMITPSASYAPAVRSMKHASFYETKGDGALEKIRNYLIEAKNISYVLVLSIGALSSVLFFMLFSFGWWIAWRDRETFPRSILIFLTLPVFYFLVITGPIIGTKYRLPIEPIMTVFIAYIGIRLCAGKKTSSGN